MRKIIDERIIRINGKFHVKCIGCGKVVEFSHKASAHKMLARKNCRNCKRDYRNIDSREVDIYKNEIGKWCSICSGCGVEQAYTRKDHAKQSSLADWQCKKCVSSSKGFSENKLVGDRTRVYRKFKKSAFNRNLEFDLTEENFYRDYNGICSLTGWEIDISYKNQTASVDRIDNSKGYILGNVQWVHSRINMSRGKQELEDFISMCEAVCNHINR